MAVEADEMAARLRAEFPHANPAMYEAKRAGGGCWRRFEDTEQTAADRVLPTA